MGVDLPTPLPLLRTAAEEGAAEVEASLAGCSGAPPSPEEGRQMEAERLVSVPARLSTSTCSPRTVSTSSTTAESPTMAGRSAMTDLLLPFALLRIKALETAVAGQQTQLNELRPLQRDVEELHSAITGLRESAQGDLEDGLSAEVAALSDHVTTLERCVEENDARLNSVQTAALHGHVEAAMVLYHRLHAAPGHPLEEEVANLRAVMPPQLQVMSGSLRSRTPAATPALEPQGEISELTQHVKSLDGRIEECFRLLREAKIQPVPQCWRADGADAGHHALWNGFAACGTRQPAKEDGFLHEFDDDVGEAEAPAPRPCRSRLAVERQNAFA